MGEELLARVGIELADPNRSPETYAELIRIARRLDKSGLQSIGLWPAGKSAAVPPLAIQLGSALADLCHGTVAVIDANVYFPALPVAEESRAEEGPIFTTRWLHGSVALIVPRWVGEVGAGVPQLRETIERNRDAFAHLLVDLTGFDYIGDHGNAIALLEGVAIVGRAGKTHERELLERHLQIPPERNLGVILVG